MDTSEKERVSERKNKRADNRIKERDEQNIGLQFKVLIYELVK